MLNAVDFLKLGCQMSYLSWERHLSRPKNFHLDVCIKSVELLGFFDCLLFFKAFEYFDGIEIKKKLYKRNA
jgi:hypothetical protein